MEVRKPSLDTFQFRESFVDITETQFDAAVDQVWIMFSGVLTCWAMFSDPLRTQKRQLAMELLVAWLLMQMYPESAISGTGTGGLPLESKTIQYISLRYRNVVNQAGPLGTLTTNSWGIQFLLLFQTAPECFQLWY